MQVTMSHMDVDGLLDIVDRAYNGMQAMERVREAHSKKRAIYSLVLTDISMPVMDGYELADEIRNYYRQNCLPQPMIVACTGHIEDQFINKAWLHEIDEIVPKPLHIDILRVILDQFM